MIFEDSQEQEILSALRAAGCEAEPEEIRTRVYRRTSPARGGAPVDAWIRDYAGVPDVAEIAADLGGGAYVLKCYFKTAAGADAVKSAVLRVDSSAAGAGMVQAPAPAPAPDMFEQFEKFVAIMQKIQPPQHPAPVQALPDLSGIMAQQMEQMSRMQRDSIRMLQESEKNFRGELERMREQYESEYDDDDDDDGNEIDIPSLVAQYAPMLPQLLGPMGSALVPLVKSAPMFLKIRNNITVLRELFGGAKIGSDDITRLVKILDLPASLLPEK